MLRPIIALLAVLLLSACSTTPSPGLAGSEWRPVEIAGQTPASSQAMFVAFGGDGALHGNGGCNAFTGGYESDGNRLAVTPLAATRMACPEPAMSDENAFLAALQGSTAFLREHADLTLLDGEGSVLLRLVQTDWD
jgi:heat shock protein HslJ